MHDKLREYVEMLFKGAPAAKQITEIKEEIIQNTIDRYDDLVRAGKTPGKRFPYRRFRNRRRFRAHRQRLRRHHGRENSSVRPHPRNKRSRKAAEKAEFYWRLA